MVIESNRDNKQFALMFIDLDGFKDINDRYGHKVGDEVLITVGNRLLKCVGQWDNVARMGGDEFTIIIQNIEDKKSINKIVEKIHKTLKEVMEIGNFECRVNSSIGVAIYPYNGNDGKTLLRNADSLMYEIKKNGKGDFKLLYK